MKDKTLMTSGSIGRKMLYFSVPLILRNLSRQLYNLVDSVVVGRFVGDNALAAVVLIYIKKVNWLRESRLEQEGA